MMRTLVVWGAGRVGRGFTADLFHEPQWRTVFVDLDARLIRLLNERRAYTIFKAQSGGISRTRIEGGFSALHTSEAAALEDVDKDSLLVRSPMVGMFYLSPSPDEDPFVKVGQEVLSGQTMAIVEAMKMMNEITAPTPGVVVEVLAANGTQVEYDQPLFRISTSANA